MLIEWSSVDARACLRRRCHANCVRPLSAGSQISSDCVHRFGSTADRGEQIAAHEFGKLMTAWSSRITLIGVMTGPVLWFTIDTRQPPCRH